MTDYEKIDRGICPYGCNGGLIPSPGGDKRTCPCCGRQWVHSDDLGPGCWKVKP